MFESDLVDTLGHPLKFGDVLSSESGLTSFAQLLREATQSVEEELNLEDSGWTRLGQVTADVVSAQERISNLKASRIYYTKDPLGRQAIRLWTDYTFGSGMSAQAQDEGAQKILSKFWDAPQNRSVLSARGQRRSSDKLLVDGEVFFVMWLGPGGQATIRWVDPLEITEIVTDTDDIETPRYYDREWTDRQGFSHSTFYRSTSNLKNESTKNASGQPVSATDDGIVLHLTYNTISQRGNPLLLPALDWIKQYRRFLASRVAIMLALSRFAWHTKVVGGQAAVDAIKAKLNVASGAPEAASVLLENMGSDTNPIKTDTGARNAYDDGRMLKLQIAAATGIPEQYFGDISIGNLATAKTVELPMMKQFQSLQKVWEDFYQEANEVVFLGNNIKPDKWYVDINWPLIAPRDTEAAANAIEKMVTVFPQFADSEEIQQTALTILGIDDVAEVLDNLEKVIQSNPDAKFARVLRELQFSLKGDNNGKKEAGIKAEA